MEYIREGIMDRKQILCESCNEEEGTTRSANPGFSGYVLCAECAAEYDSRPDPTPYEEE